MNSELLTPLIASGGGPQGVTGGAGPAGAGFTAAQSAKLDALSTERWFEEKVIDETTALTASAVTPVATFRVPRGFLLNQDVAAAFGVRLAVTTAPVGADLIVDIKQNGISIFSTLPRIVAGSKSSLNSSPQGVLKNNYIVDDAEMQVFVTQVGSSTAGAGLKVYMIGQRAYSDMTVLTPAFTDSFDTAVAKMKRVYKFDFGSSKVSSAGVTAVPNFATLAQYFDPRSRNAGAIVINKENQRYVDMPTDPSSDSNFVMASDALELTATYVDPTGQPSYRYRPTGPVNKSRKIPLSSAALANITVGQTFGIVGNEGDISHARLRTYVMDGSLSVGDVFSVAFNTRDNVVPSFTLSTVVLAGSTYATLAADMVNQVNTHPVLMANNVQAYVMPECPGGYVISYPRRPIDAAGAPDMGYTAKGSLLYWNWGATSVTALITGLATIGTITPGGSNVGAITFTKAVAYGGVDNRTVTITCTTAGGSGVAKVSIAADGTNAAFTTLTNQTVTNGTNLTLPDSGRITPSITTALSVGDTWTVQLLAPCSHQARQEMFCNYVVEKGDTFVKVASPVTMTVNSVCVFSPSLFLHVANNAFNKPNIPIGVGLEALVALGRCASFSYQDNNLRIITATASGQITIEANVYAYKGLIMHISPVNMALSSAGTTANDTLTFTSVPAGVKPGMFAANYFGSPYSTGIVKVLAVTSTTVQLNTAVTAGSGTRWAFAPEIYSAQIWSRFIMGTGLDNRFCMAMELECDIPKAVDVGSFPAFWGFSDTTDPNSTAGGSGTTEVDFTDHFVYFNNSSTGNYIPAKSNSHTGTMQAGSGSLTAILATGASQIDGAYVGQNVVTTGGTGNGQTRLITAYNGATRTATIDPALPWTTTPNGTTTYNIVPVNLYRDPVYAANGNSFAGNNLGSLRPSRKIQCLITMNRVYFYLDGLLMDCSTFSWNTYRRCQFAANLAMGTINTSFIANGFFPVDLARLPVKFRLKNMSFWSGGNEVAPAPT